MKKLWLLTLIVLIALSACGNTPPKNPTAVSPVSPSSTPAEGYPAPALPSPGYPAPEGNNVIGDMSAFPTQTADPANTPMIIEDVIKQGDSEMIIIKNISSTAQDLQLYTLVEPESQQFKTFTSQLINPGETFQVINGPNPENIVDNAHWLSEPLLSLPGDKFHLLNQAARILWTWIYFP